MAQALCLSQVACPAGGAPWGSVPLGVSSPPWPFFKRLLTLSSLTFSSAKEQMKKLLELVREYTDDLIIRDFKAGDRDQDELSHGEVRHAVRKLKQLTDSDYDTLRKEAANFDENGHSSESSATEEYRGQRGILDIEWPAELIATVSRFRKSTLTLIKPRFYSKSTEVFGPDPRQPRPHGTASKPCALNLRSPETRPASTRPA